MPALKGKRNQLTTKFVKEQAIILKFQVQSRHINRKLYRCFIGYRPNSIGVAGIERYACECDNGRRKDGCCPHIVAIIYYLSHAKYLSRIVGPAEICSKLFTVYETEFFLQKLHVCCMKIIKNILFKIISIAIYKFFPPLRKVMNTTPLTLFVF